jgi:hypothetical protein
MMRLLCDLDFVEKIGYTKIIIFIIIIIFRIQGILCRFDLFRTCGKRAEKLVILRKLWKRSIGVIVTVLPIPGFDPHRTTGAPSAVGSWSKAWA